MWEGNPKYCNIKNTHAIKLKIQSTCKTPIRDSNQGPRGESQGINHLANRNVQNCLIIFIYFHRLLLRSTVLSTPTIRMRIWQSVFWIWTHAVGRFVCSSIVLHYTKIVMRVHWLWDHQPFRDNRSHYKSTASTIVLTNLEELNCWFSWCKNYSLNKKLQ